MSENAANCTLKLSSRIGGAFAISVNTSYKEIVD
jgi:hypothetical protein